MIEDAIRAPGARERALLLEALALAFRDNPMNVEIHGPDPARRVRANRAGLRALVLDAARPAISRVIGYENELVGGFVAVPPGSLPLPAPSLRRQVGCLLSQGARAMERWARVAEAMGRTHPLQPHWYLAVLGVRPDRQGRGFGGQLLDELARVVAREPAPLYLESDRAESVAFYRAHGFEIRGVTRVFDLPCWQLGRGFADDEAVLCDSVREDPVFPPDPPTACGAARPPESEVAP